MEDCIFCKIIKGEISSKFIFENDFVVAFNDINPKAQKHILIVPKAHIASLNELEDEKLVVELFKAIKEVTSQEGIKEFRTVINTGKSAGQEVFHLHIHILSGFKV